MGQDAGVQQEFRRVTPTLPRHVANKLCALIAHVKATEPVHLGSELRRLDETWAGSSWSLDLRAVAVVLADLLDQGWHVDVDDVELILIPPGLKSSDETVEAAKERLRNSLYVGRDRQMSDPAVRRFVDRMVSSRTGPSKRASVADLIDDGTDLARQFKAVNWSDPSTALDQLRDLVDPVVQACDDRTRCELTGLRLLDIWRFFRHTWALEYRSIPGLQLPLLIRNRARPGWPVMGIALLASPVLRTRPRDNWIGWVPEAFQKKVAAGEWAAADMLESMRIRVEQSLSEIRSDDLLTKDEISNPSERVIFRLEQKAAGAAAARNRELQERYAESLEAEESIQSDRSNKDCSSDTDWASASEELLFVRKRAETLSRLLYAKRVFADVDWSLNGEELLSTVLGSTSGERAISIALQEYRKAGLSSQIADVSVCGAVAPYGELLGGKLVALLMTSEEVRGLYRDRYSEQVSIISSQMAGRPVTRPSELKIITTTSLYGSGSSQYNRLRIRASDYDFIKRDINWLELEKTAGFGTVHLGPASVRLLRQVSERDFGGRRVNHRFGEGASPRLRQVREGLDALGINSDAVLHHSTPRLFYACALEADARDQLVGLASSPSAPNPQSVAEIAEAWRRRWLVQRVQRPESLASLSVQGPQTVLEQLDCRLDEAPAQGELALSP